MAHYFAFFTFFHLSVTFVFDRSFSLTCFNKSYYLKITFDGIQKRIRLDIRSFLK